MSRQKLIEKAMEILFLICALTSIIACIIDLHFSIC